MDYEVFLLSRMKEVWDRTGDNHGGRRPRARAERPDRHVGGADRRRRRGLVRVRRHRPDQGARDRDGARGRPRRDRRPGAARAGDDAPARASGTGGRRAWARRVPAVGTAVLVARAVRVLAGVHRRRSSPRRRPPTRRRRPQPPPRLAPRRPAVRSRSRRDDAPHDRLTEWWYYTGHLRPTTGGRLRLRVRDLPGRARRAAGVVGVAPRAHRRDGGDVLLRPADGDRRRRRRGRRPTGFDLAIAGPGAGRRRWRMAGGDGRDVLDAPRPRDRELDRAVRASGSTSRSRDEAGGAPRRRTAGSTSGRPAGRTTTRGRRWRPAGTLTLDGDELAVTGDGLVRPPVGRLHRGRRRRLGLVRGQPRRRHRPDALARPRRRRLLPARLRHARRRRRRRPPPAARRVRGRGHRPLDEPGDRRRLPGRLAHHDPRRGPRDRPPTRRSPTRSSTRGRRPASSTGRARRSSAATRGGQPLGGEAYVELTGYGPSGRRRGD